MKKRWLANLRGNEKAIALLLKFLKTIGIRRKEGAKKKELEWARKHDQEGENIFG